MLNGTENCTCIWTGYGQTGPYAGPVRGSLGGRHRRGADLDLLVAHPEGRLRAGRPQGRQRDQGHPQAGSRATKSASAALRSTYPVEQAKGKDLVFICGGIGLVPQRSFIRYVLDNRSDYGKVTMLMGTKCYDHAAVPRGDRDCGEERKDMTVMETIDDGARLLGRRRRRRHDADPEGRMRPAQEP